MNKSGEKKPTLSAVANDVGVSISVVSRVLRNKQKRIAITAKTRLRVLESALRLGIKLNDNIGVFIPSGMMNYDLIHYPFIAGIFEQANNHHLGVYSHSFSEELGYADIPPFLENRDIRGAVFLAEAPSVLVDFMDDNLIPHVIADIAGKPLDNNCVSIDYAKTTENLLTHLFANGYRKFILVSNSTSRKFMPLFERIEFDQFNDFISSTPTTIGEIVYHAGSLSEDLAVLAGKVEFATKTTVFIVESRLFTMELIKLFALHSKTVSVDVGLVGSYLLSEYSAPKFISVKYDFNRIGKDAVQLLNEVLDDQNAPKSKRVVTGDILF